MLDELVHQVVGDDITVDGWVTKALEVFDLIGSSFDLDGAGLVFDDGKFQLTSPLAEFAAHQLDGGGGRVSGQSVFSQIQEPAPMK